MASSEGQILSAQVRAQCFAAGEPDAVGANPLCWEGVTEARCTLFVEATRPADGEAWLADAGSAAKTCIAALLIARARFARALTGDTVVPVAVEAYPADGVRGAAVLARARTFRQLARPGVLAVLDYAVKTRGGVAIQSSATRFTLALGAAHEAIARGSEAQDREDFIRRDVRVGIGHLDRVDALRRLLPGKFPGGQLLQAKATLLAWQSRSSAAWQAEMTSPEQAAAAQRSQKLRGVSGVSSSLDTQAPKVAANGQKRSTGICGLATAKRVPADRRWIRALFRRIQRAPRATILQGSERPAAVELRPRTAVDVQFQCRGTWQRCGTLRAWYRASAPRATALSRARRTESPILACADA